MQLRRRYGRCRLRVVVKRVVASLLLATTALGAAAGARTLFWCPTMEVALERCCCPQREAPSEHATLERAPCCETRELSGAPPAIAEHRADVPVERAPALIAAVTAPHLARVAELEPAVRDRAGRARVGPDVPIYALHRSFLI
jgi:hypothetical protein